MELRDKLMSQSYFDYVVELTDTKGIKGALKHIEDNPTSSSKRRAQYIFSVFVNYYEILLLRYSRGDALVELAAYFSEVVDAWEWAHREEVNAFNADEMAGRKRFDRNLDIYVICVWLLSLALCLKVDDALFARILKLCGNEGSDWLFELLAASRVQGRKSATSLCYPKTYGLLKFAVEAKDQKERNRLMKGFLQRWYASLSTTYWHDNHTGPEGGGYFGYWCFEAAGVVKACHWDDRVFGQMPHYPQDLTAHS